jgi:hypothetical protein
MGLVMLAAGLFTILTAGAGTPVLVLLAGTMATAGGIATTGASAVQLGVSYSGQTTAQQDQQMTHAIQTTASLSSPGGLVGGTIGVAVADDPERGLRNGALIGGLTEVGTGVVRFGVARLAPGSTTAFTSNAPEIVDLANKTRASAQASGVYGIAAHGAPGIVENAAGAAVPISDLAPMIQSAPNGRVVLLACDVAGDPAAVQSLANQTGRSVTAFSSPISTWNTNVNNVLQVPVAAGNPAPFMTAMPQYLSPYLNFTPNVAAPAAVTLSGAAPTQ